MSSRILTPRPAARRTTWLPARLAAPLLAVALAGCTIAEGAEVGLRAPEFAAPTLDGDTMSLSAMRGEVVLLNVWATWCFPCIREMPSLDDLQREFAGSGLRVVGVSIDRGASADADIRAFVAEHDLSLTVLHDPDARIARVFRTRGIPETWLVGRDGVLLAHWIGRIDGRSEAIRRPVRDALEGRPIRRTPGGAGPRL
jgi:cytochrome c biogenesis protein CcmG, thiol:disulfide interchange protein DsbE